MWKELFLQTLAMSFDYMTLSLRHEVENVELCIFQMCLLVLGYSPHTWFVT